MKRLFLVYVFSVISSISYISAQNEYNSDIDISWHNEVSDTFTIKTASQLKGFASLVNAGKSFERKTIKLEKDIILNDTTSWQSWNKEADGLSQWIPIGRKQTPFSGTFDGQNFSIYGIYLENESSGFYKGFFGFVKGANVSNLSIKKSYIKAYNSVGALIGAAIDNSVISNCHNYAIVTGKRNCIGGIVGISAMDNTLMDCSNHGKVSGLHRTGGIIGSTLGKIKVYNCYNTGEVSGILDDTGGIAGYMTTREEKSMFLYKGSFYIINCFNSGIIKGRSSVGGIVGGIGGEDAEDNDGNTIVKLYFSNLYSSGKIISEYTSLTDGLVGKYEMYSIARGIKRYGDKCFWNTEKCSVVSIDSYWHEFIESPKNIIGLTDEYMKSVDFVKILNEWVDKKKSNYKLKRWIMDTKGVNRGFPIFEDTDIDPI